MSDLLTDVLVHLLEQCRRDQTPVAVHALSRRIPVHGRVAGVWADHAVIAWGEAPDESAQLTFEDILRVSPSAQGPAARSGSGSEGRVAARPLPSPS